jgi:hypothetical protein
MAVLRTGEAVNHFVDSAVTAAGNDELAAVASGTTRDFRGLAGPGSFGQIGLYAARAEDAACFVELGTASRPPATSVGVVNQQCVAQISHRSLCYRGARPHG